MFIFKYRLTQTLKPIYKICNLSGLVLYTTSKYKSAFNINKICKRLKGDYIFANINNVKYNEILVVKDENKPKLLDLINRYRITSYFYKKVCAILKIYCYPTDYVLIYKLVQLDAQFIKFYLNIKPSRLYKCICYNNECYKFLPAKMKNNKTLINELLDRSIDIGPYLSIKLLKDTTIAMQILMINSSNINYLILAHDITSEFITLCESVYPFVFNRIKSEYLFRLTNLPNGINNILQILSIAPEQLVFDFFKFDLHATRGNNIRSVLSNKKYAYLIQYAPEFSNYSVSAARGPIGLHYVAD